MSDEWGTFASGDNQNDEDADDDWGEFTTTTETKDDDTTPTKVDQQDQQNQQNQEEEEEEDIWGEFGVDNTNEISPTVTTSSDPSTVNKTSSQENDDTSETIKDLIPKKVEKEDTQEQEQELEQEQEQDDEWGEFGGSLSETEVETTVSLDNLVKDNNNEDDDLETEEKTTSIPTIESSTPVTANAFTNETEKVIENVVTENEQQQDVLIMDTSSPTDVVEEKIEQDIPMTFDEPIKEWTSEGRTPPEKPDTDDIFVKDTFDSSTACDDCITETNDITDISIKDEMDPIQTIVENDETNLDSNMPTEDVNDAVEPLVVESLIVNEFVEEKEEIISTSTPKINVTNDGNCDTNQQKDGEDEENKEDIDKEDKEDKEDMEDESFTDFTNSTSTPTTDPSPDVKEEKKLEMTKKDETRDDDDENDTTDAPDATDATTVTTATTAIELNTATNEDNESNDDDGFGGFETSPNENNDNKQEEEEEEEEDDDDFNDFVEHETTTDPIKKDMTETNETNEDDFGDFTTLPSLPTSNPDTLPTAVEYDITNSNENEKNVTDINDINDNDEEENGDDFGDFGEYSENVSTLIQENQTNASPPENDGFGDFATSIDTDTTTTATDTAINISSKPIVSDEEEDDFGDFTEVVVDDETNKNTIATDKIVAITAIKDLKEDNEEEEEEEDDFGDFEDIKTTIKTTKTTIKTKEKTNEFQTLASSSSSTSTSPTVSSARKSAAIAHMKEALLRSCGQDLSTLPSSTSRIEYPTEAALFEKREKDASSMNGYGTNTFWGPSRCSKCKMLVRFLSTVCMSCGYRMKMNAAPGRALEGTITERLLMIALDLPSGAELKESNINSAPNSPKSRSTPGKSIGNESDVSEDMELFKSPSPTQSPRSRRSAHKSSSRRDNGDAFDSAFSVGVSNNETSFGDNLLSSALGDLGLDDENDGFGDFSSSNHASNGSASPDIFQLLQSKSSMTGITNTNEKIWTDNFLSRLPNLDFMLAQVIIDPNLDRRDSMLGFEDPFAALMGGGSESVFSSSVIVSNGGESESQSEKKNETVSFEADEPEEKVTDLVIEEEVKEVKKEEKVQAVEEIKEVQQVEKVQKVVAVVEVIEVEAAKEVEEVETVQVVEEVKQKIVIVPKETENNLNIEDDNQCNEKKVEDEDGVVVTEAETDATVTIADEKIVPVEAIEIDPFADLMGGDDGDAKPLVMKVKSMQHRPPSLADVGLFMNTQEESDDDSDEFGDFQ